MFTHENSILHSIWNAFMCPGHILSTGKVAKTPQKQQEKYEEEENMKKNQWNYAAKQCFVQCEQDNNKRWEREREKHCMHETNRVCKLRKRSGNST